MKRPCESAIVCRLRAVLHDRFAFAVWKYLAKEMPFSCLQDNQRKTGSNITARVSTKVNAASESPKWRKPMTGSSNVPWQQPILDRRSARLWISSSRVSHLSCVFRIDFKNSIVLKYELDVKNCRFVWLYVTFKSGHHENVVRAYTAWDQRNRTWYFLTIFYSSEMEREKHGLGQKVDWRLY